MCPCPSKRHLLQNILGISVIDHQKTAVMVPGDTWVEVGICIGKMTEIAWQGQILTVFTEDLDARSEPGVGDSI
jgi:hypothetical protein